MEHVFQDEDEPDITETYIGIITKIIRHGSGKNINSGTLYEIVYDVQENSDSETDSEDEPETVFEYPLLEDYYDGSLKIIED